MTLLYYLKPANSMIVGPHEWSPEMSWDDGLKRKKKKTRKEIRIERMKRISNDDESIFLLFLEKDFDD